MGIQNKAEGSEETERWAELGGDGGEQEARAAGEGERKAWERERDFLKEEVDGRERVGGEEERVHVDDTADGSAREAEGRQGVFEGKERGKRGGTEGRIQAESFVRVDV